MQIFKYRQNFKYVKCMRVDKSPDGLFFQKIYFADQNVLKEVIDRKGGDIGTLWTSYDSKASVAINNSRVACEQLLLLSGELLPMNEFEDV